MLQPLGSPVAPHLVCELPARNQPVAPPAATACHDSPAAPSDAEMPAGREKCLFCVHPVFFAMKHPVTTLMLVVA